MKKYTTYALAGGIMLFAGCFTSVGPVYDDDQVFQDRRIEGVFENTTDFDKTGSPKRDGSKWIIAGSADQNGKYQVFVKDGAAEIELLGTLFRLDKVVFFDLYPMRDSGMYHVGGGPPTVSEIIHGTMYERRHVIWKVELSETNLTYWFPYGNGIVAALKKAPALRRKTDDETTVIILPESRKDAQNYLRQFATNSEVFNFKGQLIRKKSESN